MGFKAVIVLGKIKNDTLLEYLVYSVREAGAVDVSIVSEDSKPYDCTSTLVLKAEMPLLTPSSITAMVKGEKVNEDGEEFLLVDSQAKAAEALRIMRARINAGHMANGVAMPDPDTVYINHKVHIETQSIVMPNTSIEGASHIGRNCVIGPNSVLTDAVIGDGASVFMSVVNESEIGEGTTVGPFAYIRPGSKIGKSVRVGDFVEIKNANVGDGTKISHLTYIGDADVGAGVNFGCGTVTANYNGKIKQRTTIKDGAFIGCNTNLIAPVTVGENAYTAAGSTIDKHVPDGALAVAREKQRNIEGWVDKKNGK